MTPSGPTVMNTKEIRMTAAETSIWDGDHDAERREVMDRLRIRAQARADACGHPIEIYTRDGITVESVEPEVAS